jgi:hypothetical protein
MKDLNMKIKKITTGYVVQVFDTDGEFLSQEFVASDSSDYETEDGDTVDDGDLQDLYHPFNMQQ